MFEAFGDSRPPARLEQRKPQDALERIEAALPMPEPGEGAPSVDLFAVPAFEHGDAGGRLHRMAHIHQVTEERGAAS
ncbi:hypothetical protein ACFV98_02715 [Streptomyces violascens]|uniref:hypothetical protein n=1 Tax=Streptomyces violascens TaxID=67381 RepID=UPI00364906AC